MDGAMDGILIGMTAGEAMAGTMDTVGKVAVAGAAKVVRAATVDGVARQENLAAVADGVAKQGRAAQKEERVAAGVMTG